MGITRLIGKKSGIGRIIGLVQKPAIIAAVTSVSLAFMVSDPASPAGAPQALSEAISPVEDLMREHGVLRRVLLIYEEAANRLDRADGTVSPETIARAAGIVRSFVEAYHEKLEEDYIFPRFDSDAKLAALAKTLRTQHEKGRQLTGDILRDALASNRADADVRKRLSRSLRLFIRMYRPHAAREDTELFPGLRPLLTPREYDLLGETFEAKEDELFGDHGFEKVVGEVAGLEKELGMNDLEKFTPNLGAVTLPSGQPR